ncbi:DUF4625 domain-containing protein [Cesiribacter andamanensis]|uniref:DUF4625 domain-containing protein n=1 Tax=Cesiribacter andamanensis AMV16 TaxID=1279009 RepID=M7NCB7_9BACT|nr:DUF4625 domain-containing protein [Cesiribacter andamanensis]EMR04791.1 hypothetical protein ADICEAN_00062 [Cesiribacter andamanensis AMV16]
MNSIIRKSFLFVCLSFGILACKDDDAPANTPPVFAITSPTDAQIEAGFVVGQTVQIAGTVTDNSEVETIVTSIYYNGFDTGQGETIQVGQASYSIDYSVQIPSNAPAGTYRIVLLATDDEGLTASWDKTFQVRNQ